MRHGGQNSSGGTRRRQERHEERPAAYTPAPSTHALLQATFGKRELLTHSEKELIRTFLDRLRSRALTEKELQCAIKIGKRIGIGYDDPALDVNEPTQQPWGPLPLKPPTKRTFTV